tara:strand:+ start:4227 stop:5171 length:945 start_codon:yes stop_codon:yes gene_type:complete
MIFVSGENLIDFISDSNLTYKPLVGGSALNTAVALGKLKSNVFFFSRISKDLFGKMIMRELVKNNVRVNLVERTEDQSTVAIVSNNKNPEFNIYKENTASINLKKFKIKKNIFKRVKLSHFSSISLAIDPSANTHLKLIASIKKNSKSLISIDPNIRPSIINNKRSYIKKFYRFLKLANIIKMSKEDYEYISNKNPDIQIKKWIKKYSINIFILTLGSEGSILYNDKYRIFQKANKIKVNDTVGAGDSFIAGIISFLEKGRFLNLKKLINLSKEDLENCLFFASKVAEKNCLKKGCNPPNLNEVNKFIKLDTLQ